MAQMRHLPIIAGPSRSRKPFTFSAAMRVGFSDTDAQGIVYYGRYAPYFDIARVEYWRNLGLSVTGSPQANFVMRAFSIEYHAPARFDDLLEVFCRISRLGSTSVTFEFAVVKEDGQLLATATQTLVHIRQKDEGGHVSEPIEAGVRDLIESFEPNL